MNWIKKYSQNFDTVKSISEPSVIEIDELHTYIGSKKNSVGYGLLLIDRARELSTSLLVIGAKKQVKNSTKQ